MGKMKTLIEGLKGGVRRKLEALPPKATGFGKGNGAMEIRHIEKLDLPVQENMNLYNNVYGKGTEEE